MRKPQKCPVCGERVVDIIYGREWWRINSAIESLSKRRKKKNGDASNLYKTITEGLQ